MTVMVEWSFIKYERTFLMVSEILGVQEFHKPMRIFL